MLGEAIEKNHNVIYYKLFYVLVIPSHSDFYML